MNTGKRALFVFVTMAAGSAALVSILGTLTTGCGVGTSWFAPIDWYPDAGDAGDGGDASELTCEGQCIPFRPIGWSDPILVVRASPGTPLECPAEAPEEHFRSYADLSIPPLGCECACKPSTGTCKPPTTMTAHNAVCNTPGTVDTSFDPPADWDGSCSASNSIPGGALCNGVPCVQSLTIGPMAIVDESCKVDPVPVPKANYVPPSWGLNVIGCEGYPLGGEGGCGVDSKCAPLPVPPPEFQVCVYKEGDVQCDGSHYTDRLVIYSGFKDKRICGECGCGAEVTGSTCSAFASVNTDSACVDPLMPGVQISSIKEGCFDLTMPGQPLGSKEITAIQYHPGTCQPFGGEPQGEVEKLRAATLCCWPKNDK